MSTRDRRRSRAPGQDASRSKDRGGRRQPLLDVTTHERAGDALRRFLTPVDLRGVSVAAASLSNAEQLSGHVTHLTPGRQALGTRTASFDVALLVPAAQILRTVPGATDA